MNSKPLRGIGIGLLVACLGCGPDHDYDLAPVHGVVTINGKPLPAGRVQFAPVAASGALKSGKPGFGDIEPDGSYTISTYGHEDGAVAAEHWVTIINTQKEAVGGLLLGASRVKVPIRQTVASGTENVIPIELTTDDIKRYGEGAD